MKSIVMLIFFILVPFSSGLDAQEPAPKSSFPFSGEGTIEKDRWEPDKRWNFIDPDTGRETGGYIKRDRWEPEDRWNIYDKDGRQKGTIERDRWDKDRFHFREKK
jgi:hypothetical protein